LATLVLVAVPVVLVVARLTGEGAAFLAAGAAAKRALASPVSELVAEVA